MSLLDALAGLPDDAQVTVTVRKGDLVRALETRVGGPALLTTRQAASAFGFSGEQWKRWAEQGRIEGAWKVDQRGHWRLPRAGCEAHLRTLLRQGHTPAPASPPLTSRSVSRAPSLQRIAPAPPKLVYPAGQLSRKQRGRARDAQRAAVAVAAASAPSA